MATRDSKRIASLIDRALADLASPQTSLVPAVGIALNVARQLHMGDEIKWLEAELRGYRADPGKKPPSSVAEALGLSGNGVFGKEIAAFRVVRASFYVQTSRRIERMPYPFFITDSVAELESRLARMAPDTRGELTIPLHMMAPHFRQGLQKLGLSEVTIYLTPAEYAAVASGLRGDLAIFLTAAQLVLPKEEESSIPATSVSIVGGVHGHRISIVNASSGAVVNLGEPSTRMSPDLAVQTLREEIAAIQDLVIASRRDYLEFEKQSEAVKKQLSLITDQVADALSKRHPAGATVEDLRRLANEVLGDLHARRVIDAGLLNHLVGLGFQQSLLASTLVEAVKALIPT